ncbi:unnamed protein product [Didymodactylos carnosus]|uniref:Uncharacterized protein n=1 Tax=Didymodactylos carnosus TaxID=1234261 RepID=A0A814LN93_9BILA|nr:unnamed protein product [Didymodactylos carnosus]CAF1065538.1 unnamed protein product [Didymodactylos carnosus]CAF3516530.1 unnamed protein product [Didymodactylos carnosus]CAF3833264.1 unnamed protein product [Didymodactylos carnosus]
MGSICEVWNEMIIGGHPVVAQCESPPDHDDDELTMIYVEQEQGIDDAASDKNQSMSPNPDDYEPELPQSEHVDDFQNEFRCCWPKKVGTIESNSPVAPPKPIVLPAPTTKQGDLGNPSLDHTQILDIISITSLTYSIIGTLVLICCLALFWVLLEEPAIGSGEPMTLDHIMSKEQLENIIELGRTAFPELKTEDAKSEDKKEAVKRDGIRTERETSKGDLTSKRQLTGAAKKIRERKEEENSKNVKRKIHLRKNSSDDDDEDNA